MKIVAGPKSHFTSHLVTDGALTLGNQQLSYRDLQHKPLPSVHTSLLQHPRAIWDPSSGEGGSGAGGRQLPTTVGGCPPANECVFPLPACTCGAENPLVDILSGLQPSLSKQASVCREPGQVGTWHSREDMQGAREV